MNVAPDIGIGVKLEPKNVSSWGHAMFLEAKLI